MATMTDFSGHTVLVTGAAAGIGFSIGAAFYAAGGRVALGDVNTSGLGRAAERLGASDRVFTHAVDVRDASSVEKFVAASESALGPVTIAVANAGIYPNCPVLEMTQEEWDRVIETNLRGVFLTCQAVARRMVAEGMPGKLITISSGAYNSGRKGAAHYCASKAGVVMFTKVLAMELGPHQINVNCIAPAVTETGMTRALLTPERRQAVLASIPLGRFATTEDIANMVLILASDITSYVTGETIVVDGGSRLRGGGV